MPRGDGSRNLDGALLMIGLVGFLPPNDERIRSTVDAIQRDLCEDGLVLRYRTDNGGDGLPGGEGAFLPCSFWLVDNLALIGRTQEALALFERLRGLCNDGRFTVALRPTAAFQARGDEVWSYIRARKPGGKPDDRSTGFRLVRLTVR